jgi:hypothetical protein
MSSWTERTSGQRRQMAGDDDPGQNQTTADSGAGTEIVPMPAELDLATSEGVPARGCAVIARLTPAGAARPGRRVILRRPRAQRLRPDR